jgi:hypothetical protein
MAFGAWREFFCIHPLREKTENPVALRTIELINGHGDNLGADDF